MIERAGGGVTLIHDHPELPESLQGHYLPSTVIGHPQAVSAVFTGLAKRRQGGAEFRLGSRGSSRHRLCSYCNKASFSTSAYTCRQGKFAVQRLFAEWQSLLEACSFIGAVPGYFTLASRQDCHSAAFFSSPGRKRWGGVADRSTAQSRSAASSRRATPSPGGSAGGRW
jgi:hypothetical protein